MIRPIWARDSSFVDGQVRREDSGIITDPPPPPPPHEQDRDQRHAGISSIRRA